MTFSEIVDMLKRGLEGKELSNVLKFDCGDDGSVAIGPYGVSTENPDADCTIKITTANLEKLLKGKLNPMTGLAMGKLKISGNPAVAMQLAKLI